MGRFKVSLIALLASFSGALLGLLFFIGYEVFFRPLCMHDMHNGFLRVGVEEGEGINHLAEGLFRRRIIRHPKVLAWTYRLAYHTPVLKGTYLIHQHDTLWKLVQRLGKRARLRGRFTIVEGWQWHQVFQALREEKRIEHHSQEQIRAYFCPHDINRHYPYACLEGAFLAGTYFFYEGSDDLSILKTAFEAKDESLKRLWNERDSSVTYRNAHESLIVASLIQKESAKPAEYAKIAGVILKRLKEGMRLQIDAGVLYGLGRNSGLVRFKDLKKPTAYNNYLRHGLPPTPIAYVDEHALYAALHPDNQNAYLYYVADGKGGHAFARSYQSHMRLKRQYQTLKSKRSRT